MGAEVLVPLALAAAGTGVQTFVQQKALRDQDEAAAQGIRVQAGHQREADARVAQEVANLEQSSPEAAQKSATDAFMDQLRRTRASAQGEQQIGALSDEYNTGAAKAGKAIDQYGANRAGTLARINAPAVQRQNETFSRLRAGTDLGLIDNAAQGDQFLAQLRQQSIRPNPWAAAGGELLAGAGSGMAANGGYGAGSTRVPKGGVKRYDAPVSGFTRGLA